MNRADVIRLAKEAGLEQLVDGMDCSDWKVEIDRFAALIAAAERERVANYVFENYTQDCTCMGKNSLIARSNKTAQLIVLEIRALGDEQ